MGRFVLGACAVAMLWWVGSGSALQLFASPAPTYATVSSPQMVVAQSPAYASPALRGAAQQVEVAPAPSGSAATIGAAVCVGAAVYVLSSRSRKAPAISADTVRRAAAPKMIVDPSHAVDVASTLTATAEIVPGLTPGKTFVMAASNLFVICNMTIQDYEGDGTMGRHGLFRKMSNGMSPKAAHNDMVERFGLTWLLSGTAFGHIVGAGAILGCEAAGVL